MPRMYPTAETPGGDLTNDEYNALAAAVAAGIPNVLHYGRTVGTGGDDTAAISEAYSDGRGAVLMPPTAAGYRYNGPGLGNGVNNAFRIVGAGPERTTLFLGSSSYLVTISSAVARSFIGGLDVQGGKGLFRHTFTGSNVFEPMTFMDLRLINFTEAALSDECVDSPYYRLYNVMMRGASPATSMGIAHSGYSDQLKAVDCNFGTLRAATKFRRPVNAHFDNCDFLQFNIDRSYGPTCAVWIVPAATLSDYGTGVPGHGMTFRDCKFGAAPAEGWVAGTDFRFLFADEGAGASIGTRMPVLNADSAGYVQAILIDSPYLAGGAIPVIYSTTPNVAQIRGRDPVVFDVPPTYWLQYRTPPTSLNTYNTGNRFDQPRGTLGAAGSFASTAGFPLTNSTHGGVWDGSQTAPVPTSPTSAGFPGMKAFDANYEYRCVAVNQWKRIALSAW